MTVLYLMLFSALYVLFLIAVLAAMFLNKLAARSFCDSSIWGEGVVAFDAFR